MTDKDKDLDTMEIAVSDPSLLEPGDQVEVDGVQMTVGPELPKLNVLDRLAMAFNRNPLPKEAHEGGHCVSCGVELAYVQGAYDGMCSKCFARQHGRQQFPRSVMRASMTQRRGHRKHHKATTRIMRWARTRQQSPMMARIQKAEADRARNSSK